MDNKDAEVFNYTYNAKQREQIKSIRQKYITAEEDKMEQLRRLDGSVSKKATSVALIFGIIGTLIMGFGMSLAMTDIGTIMNIDASMSMIIGIAAGIIGIILVGTTYPIYNRTLKKEREKIAPEIIRLTDELMK